MTDQRVGFIGLGNMGGPLATNLVKSGLDVVVYDRAGTAERAPAGSSVAASVAEVGISCQAVVLSLPDARALDAVARDLTTVREAGGELTHVVDTSTVGVEAARSTHRLLAEAGVVYVDAPVSGGAAGAVNRTIAVMFSGSDEAYARLEPVLAGLSDCCFRVGSEPGLGQAAKLANNFLSATSLIATSEAVAFAESYGVDPAVLIEVLNHASGRNSATSDKFPNHVLTGRFASGFSNALMDKDLQLYAEAVGDRSLPSTMGDATSQFWHRFAAAEPGVDFTRIYPFVKESRS